MPHPHLSVLLPDGESPIAFRVVRTLARVPNTRIHLLSTLPNPPARFSRHLESFQYFPHSTPQACIDLILRTAKKNEANVILPIREPMIRLLSEYRDVFRGTVALAPVPPPHIHDLICDKGSLALHLAAHRIPCPLTLVQLLDESNPHFAHRAASLGLPLLVKATRSNSGYHMAKCTSIPEIVHFLDSQHESGQRFLAQEFIPGHDVDISALYLRGTRLASAERIAILPHPRPFAPPIGWQFRADPAIQALADSLLTPLQWSGLANFDIRRDSRDGSLRILEVNGRFWGSVPGALQAGINFPHLACLAALGHSFPRPTPRDARFYANGLGLKQTLQALVRPSPNSFSFRQTYLPFNLADPLPVLIDHLQARGIDFPAPSITRA